MTRIAYKLFGQRTYALRRQGETEIEAVKRSILSRPGVGHISSHLQSWSKGVENHSITVCGPESKRGGWPVLCEMRVSVNV